MYKQFNQVEVDFQGSILGFEELNTFVIEAIEDTMFAYLKSVEDPSISFLITSPFQWYSKYTLQLDDTLRKKLKLEKPEDALVICIVTIKESLAHSTINLLAPLIINVNELVGMQYVFHEQTNYRTNSSLMGTEAKEEGLNEC